MKKGKTMKFIKFEKRFEVVGAVLLIFLWVVGIFTHNNLNSLNVEVERLNNSIKNQEKTNQSLSMKINELASLENIQVVANQEGLAYNNGNIIVVEEN